jgi:hypothetical protein
LRFSIDTETAPVHIYARSVDVSAYSVKEKDMAALTAALIANNSITTI